MCQETQTARNNSKSCSVFLCEELRSCFLAEVELAEVELTEVELAAVEHVRMDFQGHAHRGRF